MPGVQLLIAWFASSTQRRIELQLDDGASGGRAGTQLSRVACLGRRSAASAIRAYYGHFPVQYTRVTVERVHGSGVRGRARLPIPAHMIRVGVGHETSADRICVRLDADPRVCAPGASGAGRRARLAAGGRGHLCRARSRARKPDNCLRARMGRVRAGACRIGLPAARETAASTTRSTWARTYWGGALFCLVADVEIRKRTTTASACRMRCARSSQDGGTLDHRWPDSRCAAHRRPRDRRRRAERAL